MTGTRDMREVNPATLALLKEFEGTKDGNPSTPNLDAYMDPVGIWTIGWGHAIIDGGKFLMGAEHKARARALYPGGLTVKQAEALLQADVINAAREVEQAVKVPVTGNQFGALVSFVFNLGIGNLRGSRLLAKLNAGDYAGAAAEFAHWVYAGGNKLPGLVRRRAAESALFLTP